MTKVKKQHYVPQSYLLRFSNEGSLYVFDKVLGTSFGSNVRDVANDKYFYDVPEIDQMVGGEQVIEKFFRPFEDAAAKCISKIIESLERNRFTRIHPDQKTDLSLYLALQHLRTREARETLVQTTETINKVFFSLFLETKHPKTNFSKDDFEVLIEKNKRAAHHASSILDEDMRCEIAAILCNHYWVILKNETDIPFYTSDHPMVKHNQLKDPFRSMLGFTSVGIEIAYPLTPEYILVIAEKTAFPQLKKDNGKVQTTNNPEHIVYFNHLQIRYSYRQIFSIKPDFNLATSMIEETPDLKDIDFKRIHVNTYEENS